MLAAWICFCSLISFALMRLDKLAAQRGCGRTSEQTLLVSALIGGWPGTVLAMHLFHHKTKKPAFKCRCYLAAAINILAIWAVLGLHSSA